MIAALFIVLTVGPGLLISWWLISVLRVWSAIEHDRKYDLTGTSDR